MRILAYFQTTEDLAETLTFPSLQRLVERELEASDCSVSWNGDEVEVDFTSSLPLRSIDARLASLAPLPNGVEFRAFETED